MERVAHVMSIPTLVCLVLIIFWGNEIREFSSTLNTMLFVILSIGFLSHMILSWRSHDKQIADDAIAKSKEERGIID